MSHNYFDPLWSEKVTLPVKRVGERWEFFYGGDVPLKEGTLGELSVSADQITDERFRQRVSHELTIKVLEEGQALLVALSDRSSNVGCLGRWPYVFPSGAPPGTTRFECITLGPPKPKASDKYKEVKPELDGVTEAGGLWLKHKGLERTELAAGTVVMPAGIKPEVAISLNHAVTLLSQQYEKLRISNTGNVYTRVFYCEPSGKWYPLNDLHQGVQAAEERKLLVELWIEVEQKLGWRPMAAPEKKRRK